MRLFNIFWNSTDDEVAKIGERHIVTCDDEQAIGVVTSADFNGHNGHWYVVHWLNRLPEGTLCVFDEQP